MRLPPGAADLIREERPPGGVLRSVVVDAPAVLGLRADPSAHDAACVALAERLRAELLTADRALARAAEARAAVGVLTV